MKLSQVILFRNGMVAACDSNGQQMPELQGRFSEVVSKVLAAADADTTFLGWPDIKDDGHLGDRR